MVDKKIVNRNIVFVLILTLFAVSIFILRPILISIILAAFTAYILHPLYLFIKKRVKNENLSTIIVLLLVLVAIAIPVWIFIPKLVQEIFNAYLYVQNNDIGGTITGIIGKHLGPDITYKIASQINSMIIKFFSISLTASASTFSDLSNFLLQISIFLFTLYFAIKDSGKIKKYLSDISPLSKASEERFSLEFRNITNSIIFGQIVVGILQGLFLGLGLWILGFDRIIFLTVISIILSIIPIVGAWIVWIPASIYLLISGNILNGIILLLYGMLFVSTIDNILRAYFISKKSKNINIFVATIGTLGGLYAFGVAGLILGPLILSYSMIIIDFYKKEKLNEIFKE